MYFKVLCLFVGYLACYIEFVALIVSLLKSKQNMNEKTRGGCSKTVPPYIRLGSGTTPGYIGSTFKRTLLSSETCFLLL